MANKPSIPKGTRDFLPEQSLKRQFIFDTAKSVFQLYGFQPIETPAMENLETLTGKYGEEGDKLIFRILDSGDKPGISINAELNNGLHPDLAIVVEDVGASFVKKLLSLIEDEEFSDDPELSLSNSFDKNLKERGFENKDAENIRKEIFKSLIHFFFIHKEYLYGKEQSRFEYLKGNHAKNPNIKEHNKIIPLITQSFLNNDPEFKRSINAISLGQAKNIGSIFSEKALRYDLTVPFARFVVQNQNELSFPFKRYQIQPVWRADRPQRGRYREFYQCDVDIIGSDSLLNEAELLCIVSDVFNKLGLGDIQIRLNNRKILSGIAKASGLGGYFQEMTIAIDKIDKIGVDGVKDEMIKRGLPEGGVKKALDHIKRKGEPENVLRMLAGSLTGEEEAQRGIEEMRQTLKALPDDVRAKVSIDLTLARGLNYYTGAIIEVGHSQFPSSICGGGRYDDLTGIFGLKGMSGVGVSLGADRIYDLMEELNLFPESLNVAGQVLFVNFGEAEAKTCLKLAALLRTDGFSAEVYPDSAKMQKQMKYADSKRFKFVVLIGSDELKDGKATVKNMQTGDQFAVLQKDLTKFIFEKTSDE